MNDFLIAFYSLLLIFSVLYIFTLVYLIPCDTDIHIEIGYSFVFQIIQPSSPFSSFSECNQNFSALVDHSSWDAPTWEDALAWNTDNDTLPTLAVTTIDWVDNFIQDI